MNNLVIYCKRCGKKKRLKALRDIRPEGNFCSKECYKQWSIEHAMSSEEKRLKWNVYQNEHNKAKRLKNPEYKLFIKKRVNNRLVKTLKRRIRGLEKIQRHLRSIQKKKEREKFYKDSGLKAEWNRNPKTLAKKRENNKKPENREKRRKWKRVYKKKHPEKKISGNGGISREAFNKMRAEYGFRCAICGRKEPFKDQYWVWLTQDHIIPRSKGGKERSKDNIQPLCWDCNIKKSNKI